MFFFRPKFSSGLASELADHIIPIFKSEDFYLPRVDDFFGKSHANFCEKAVRMPEFNVYCFNGAFCFPNREEIFTSKKAIVTDLTSQKKHPFIGNREFSNRNIRHINGVVAHLSLSGLENNYYHWLVECLGRLYLLQKSGIVPDYCIVSQKQTFQKEYLELLGIPQRKIITTDSADLISADTIVYPSLINNWEYICYRNNFESYEKQFTPYWIGDLYKKIEVNKKSGLKRIFIDRPYANRRKIIGIEKIYPILSEHDFVPIDLDNKSVSEQIAIFAGAEIIVGIHGAGLVNMVHSATGTKILELFPKYYHDPSFRTLATALGHRYSYLISDFEPDPSIHPQSEDLKFREDIVAKSLASISA